MNFKTYVESTNKVLYLMRGVSGSGKSTQAQKIKDQEGGVIYSTDEFRYIGGKYVFKPEDTVPFHQKNIQRAKDAMQTGITPVIIDNTNIQYKYAEPYVKLAKKFGYEIKVIEPDSPWAFDVNELSIRNSGRAPENVIKQMMNDYETPEEFTRQIAPTQNYG